MHLTLTATILFFYTFLKYDGMIYALNRLIYIFFNNHYEEKK